VDRKRGDREFGDRVAVPRDRFGHGRDRRQTWKNIG
jgi:hypothetical protein